jgi:hypothetical protein
MTFGVLLLTSLVLAAAQPAECADAAACRQAALEAAAREEYETFHDLAWRAVQAGPRQDPELMYLLARAQSLSGRPGDALVMLRRLASMGIATDAREHEDFRRVRLLPGWPEVEALIATLGAPALESAALPDPVPGPAPSASPAVSADLAEPPAAAPVEPSASAAPRPAPAPPAPAARTAGAGAEAARRLATMLIEPAGIAYDGASRRFVLADRRLNRLVVADEVFDHVNDLIGASAGGFGTLTALTIDSRRGDLWVTSAASDGVASVHRLQLVSGRMLASFAVAEKWRPVTATDLAVTDTGTLLLLDTAGSRLLTLRGTAQSFDRAIALGVANPSSVAVSGDMAYVAHDSGLSVADVVSGKVSAIRASVGTTLTGLQRIRWHTGSLIAIQAVPALGDRLVRIRLGRGTVTAVDVLDDAVSVGDSALTLSRDAAYFLVDDDGVQVIRRVPLR